MYDADELDENWNDLCANCLHLKDYHFRGELCEYKRDDKTWCGCKEYISHGIKME